MYVSDSFKLAFCHNKTAVWTSTGVDVSLERMTIVVDAAQKQMRILKDGGTSEVNCDDAFVSKMTDKDHQCTASVRLGGVSGNPRGRMRLYGFRIYENGEKKREFIPCKSGDKVGLYETVDGEFYENDLEDGDDFKIGGASATLAVEPADTAVDVQKSATLKAIAAGAVEYRWYKDGNLIEGETGETLTVNWRKGKPYEETYEVRPVYVLFGEQVLGDSSAAVVTHGRLGLVLVVE